MKLDFCAVCGITTDLHQHHIEPVVYSKITRTKLKQKGYDREKKLKDCTSMEVFKWLFDQGVITDKGEITVCTYHHHIMHGIVKFGQAEHGKLVIEGIKKARERGGKWGRPSAKDKVSVDDVKTLLDSGMPIKKIAKQMNIGVGTMYEIMKDNNIKPNKSFYGPPKRLMNKEPPRIYVPIPKVPKVPSKLSIEDRARLRESNKNGNTPLTREDIYQEKLQGLNP